jgi:hypothetical protein
VLDTELELRQLA